MVRRLLLLAPALAVVLASLPLTAPAALASQTPPPGRTAYPGIRQVPLPAASSRALPAYTPGIDPVGHIPCDLANAYGLHAGGWTGSGVLVAIIDANDHPNASSDLTAFSNRFGLAAPSFTKYEEGVNFAGGQPAPTFDAGWASEIALDIEWVHAVAPGAAIALIETSTPNSNDLMLATDYAVGTLHADVVSYSLGVPLPAGADAGAASFVAGNQSHFPSTNGAGNPVMYLAAAGDSYSQIQWPAVSSEVVAVGGTNIAPSAFGGLSTSAHNDCSGASSSVGVNSTNETVWGTAHNTGGTGGGLADAGTSAKPAWQSGFGPSTGRAEPDVAALADPATGVAIYDSCTTLACTAGWSTGLTGGTSLATPIWAGVVALLDQSRTAAGLSRLNVTAGSNPLYSVTATAYNDITTGTSDPGGSSDPCGSLWNCSAASGFDLVTGRGSPLFANLVAQLGATAPAAPTGVSGVAGDHSVRLTWTAPSNGGSPITSYQITGTPAGTTTAPGGVTTWLVNGLTNGTPYTFTVTAINAVGTGPASLPSGVLTPIGRVSGVAGSPPSSQTTAGRLDPHQDASQPTAGRSSIAPPPAATASASAPTSSSAVAVGVPAAASAVSVPAGAAVMVAQPTLHSMLIGLPPSLVA